MPLKISEYAVRPGGAATVVRYHQSCVQRSPGVVRFIPWYRFLYTPLSSRTCRTVAGMRWIGYQRESSKPACETRASSPETFLAEAIRQPLCSSSKLGEF